MKSYVFYRDEMFYMIDLMDDADAIANAECNHGTRHVVSAWTGETVWSERPKAAGRFEYKRVKDGIFIPYKIIFD